MPVHAIAVQCGATGNNAVDVSHRAKQSLARNDGLLAHMESKQRALTQVVTGFLSSGICN
jgi:hypothetical protein